MAAATVPTPTPTGRRAATSEPNTMPRIKIDRGPETSSALMRSFLMRSSKVQSMAIPSVIQSSNSPPRLTVSWRSLMMDLASFLSVANVTLLMAYVPFSSDTTTSSRSTSLTSHEYSIDTFECTSKSAIAAITASCHASLVSLSVGWYTRYRNDCPPSSLSEAKRSEMRRPALTDSTSSSPNPSAQSAPMVNRPVIKTHETRPSAIIALRWS